MLFAAFDQQVDDFAAGFQYPVDAARMVDKAQNFYSPGKTFLFRPLIDIGDRFFFALRDTGGSDLNPVHPQPL